VIGSLGASGKRDKMIEFIVRNEKEKKIAAFPEFQDAWDYLVISLQNEGDIVKAGDNNESNS
jgi:hypothetical protein